MIVSSSADSAVRLSEFVFISSFGVFEPVKI